MDTNKLNLLNELRLKGILTSEEWENEKNKITKSSSNSNFDSDKSKISIAGKHLMNIFSAILILFIYASLLVIAEIFYGLLNFISYDSLLLLSCLVQLSILISIMYNLYKAAKNLKYHSSLIVNGKLTALSDQIEYDKYIEYMKSKKERSVNVVEVQNHCPACEQTLEIDAIECPNCKLNFK